MNPPRLPVETLEAILEHTTKNEQLALCTSSKLLYDLAIRMLYRDLKFTCSSQLVQCFRVLKSKQGHALAVTTLKIATDSDMQRLRAYFRLIKDVLARLSSLKDLSISDTHGDILDKCVFPSLCILNLGYFEDRYIPKFLGRHSNITILIFTVKDEDPVGGDLPPTYLPNLRIYMSPTRLFPSWLSRSTSLVVLLLQYDFAHPMTEKTFEALSHTPAEHLSIQLIGWNLECCGFVSKALPALKVINFTNFLSGDHDVNASQFIEHFSQFLPTFSHLEYIGVIDSTPSPLTFLGLDREYERVIKWHSMCSKLKTCEFDTGVVWTLKTNLRHFTWEPAARYVEMSGDLIDQWRQQLV